MPKEKFFYAIREKRTGRLIADLGTKHKKFWETEKACRNAILNSYKLIYWTDEMKLKEYEVVKFRLVEVKENEEA